MIQRIQTVWFLLASLAAFTTLYLSFYSGNMVDPVTGKSVFVNINARESLPLLVTSISVGAASLVAIFQYKDRKRQLLVSYIILVVSLIHISLYFVEIKKCKEGNYDLTALDSLFIPIFLVLAIVGIHSDEKLVKSADRLR